jgi:hypothetical protein
VNDYDTWSCLLHRTIDRARNLQNLKVLCHRSMAKAGGSRRHPATQDRGWEDWDESDDSEAVQEPVGRLPWKKLTQLVLPPPTVFTISVYAPNVESLEFAFPTHGGSNSLTRDHYDDRPMEERLPLIPEIKDSPVDINNMARITHLGLECCRTDTIPRLEQWLSRLPNLISLSIHGMQKFHLLQRRDQPLPDRVDEYIVHVLAARPEWNPRLTDLRLVDCKVPDDQLARLVHVRRTSPYLMPLTRVSICGHHQSTTEAHTWLHEAVVKPDGSGSGYSRRKSVGNARDLDRCDCKGPWPIPLAMAERMPFWLAEGLPVEEEE